MHYWLGIDVSTTATKALLIEAGGRVVAAAASEYGYETPHPLWSEQDPDLWWGATRESVAAVLAAAGASGADVRGIGLTGQMHGLVLLDGRGTVLRPAILWNDQRTGEQCDEIRGRLGREVPQRGGELRWWLPTATKGDRTIIAAPTEASTRASQPMPTNLFDEFRLHSTPANARLYRATRKTCATNHADLPRRGSCCPLSMKYSG